MTVQKTFTAKKEIGTPFSGVVRLAIGTSHPSTSAALRRREKGKPVVRRGRKAYGPRSRSGSRATERRWALTRSGEPHPLREKEWGI